MGASFNRGKGAVDEGAMEVLHSPEIRASGREGEGDLRSVFRLLFGGDGYMAFDDMPIKADVAEDGREGPSLRLLPNNAVFGTKAVDSLLIIGICGGWGCGGGRPEEEKTVDPVHARANAPASKDRDQAVCYASEDAA